MIWYVYIFILICRCHISIRFILQIYSVPVEACMVQYANASVNVILIQ
jgi:hypothetical protein